MIFKQISWRLSGWRVKLCWGIATSLLHWGHFNREISREHSPCRREGPFQPFFFISWLWGIYRTYLYSQSSAKVFFQISILELELQMTSITEKRKRKNTYEPFFYNSHCIFHFRKKKWLYVITTFFKACLKDK